jgi:hypothetical protein
MCRLWRANEDRPLIVVDMSIGTANTGEEGSRRRSDAPRSNRGPLALAQGNRARPHRVLNAAAQRQRPPGRGGRRSNSTSPSSRGHHRHPPRRKNEPSRRYRPALTTLPAPFSDGVHRLTGRETPPGRPVLGLHSLFSNRASRDAAGQRLPAIALGDTPLTTAARADRCRVEKWVTSTRRRQPRRGPPAETNAVDRSGRGCAVFGARVRIAR